MREIINYNAQQDTSGGDALTENGAYAESLIVLLRLVPATPSDVDIITFPN